MIDNNAELKQKILDKIESMDTFTFSQLHTGLSSRAYRVADQTIQNLRKKGLIEYKKEGRKFVWYKVKGTIK